MRRFFPTGAEVLVLAAMAISCAAVAAHVQLSEGGLVLIAFPLLLAAMLLGARRSGKLAACRQPSSLTSKARVSRRDNA